MKNLQKIVIIDDEMILKMVSNIYVTGSLMVLQLREKLQTE